MSEQKRYKVIKLPKWSTDVLVGDICVNCGGSKVLSEAEGFGRENVGKYLRQFHSILLIDQKNVGTKNDPNYMSVDRDISYWVEFLSDNCVKEI